MNYLRVNGLVLSAEDAIAYTHLFDFPMGFEGVALQTLLVKSHALAEGIEADPDDVNNTIIEWRYAKSLERRDAYQRFLDQHHVSQDALYALMEWIELEKLLKQRLPAAAVGAYYAEQRQGFERAEVLWLPCADLELLQEVKELVNEEGETLQGFAAAHSLDEASARQGGWLGWRRRAELSGEAEAAIFAARPGEVVGPFKLEGGRYEIYQLLALDQPRQEAVEGEVRERLFADLLRRLKLEAQIERFPQAPEAAVAA